MIQPEVGAPHRSVEVFSTSNHTSIGLIWKVTSFVYMFVNIMYQMLASPMEIVFSYADVHTDS